MRLSKLNHTSGFTLLEALVSLAIGVAFLTSVIGVWVYSSKNWKSQSIKTELRFDVQGALEKIKRDVRLTDGGGILFYPANSASYTAVSLPSADLDGNGLMTFEDDGTISWGKTIIYHLHNNELRRTVVDSFDSVSATRQAQLDAVVESGAADGAETSTLFEADNVTLEITPANPTFDGYSADLGISGNTNFGSVLLAAGNHTVQFKTTGKNSASSGYRFGIDRITLAPSGSAREAEDLTISASNGKTTVNEDMSSFGNDGVWSGNYQREYQASGINDYITFQTYYDGWSESNFENMTFSDAEVVGTNPVLTVTSRESQGLIPGWRASTQVSAGAADNNSSDPTPYLAINGKTIRNVILGSAISKAGQMVRLKFVASGSGALVIRGAYFGTRSGDNFVGGTTTQLHFNDGAVDIGVEDAVGTTGTTGPTSITIQAGQHAWSNWFVPSSAITSPSASDFLVSFYVDPSSANANETYWDSGATVSSYIEDGDTVTNVWNSAADAGYATNTAIHAVEEVAVWSASGTATSQIYDTTLTAPAYGALTWSTNGTGTYSIKVRSSNDSEMTGATDWADVGAYTTTPATMTAGSGRFVQFQATLTAASPYTTLPQLDQISLNWPGQTSIVQISGYYTKRPNYGIFTVLVDGQALTKALDITLNADKEYQGQTYTYALDTSVSCRNTSR